MFEEEKLRNFEKSQNFLRKKEILHIFVSKK